MTAELEEPQVTPFTPVEHLPQWLTVRQVCAYLGASKNSVYSAIAEGRIPSRRFTSRRILIPRSALEGGGE